MLDGDHGGSGHQADEGDLTGPDGRDDITRCCCDVDASVAAAPLLFRRVEPGREVGWRDGPGPEDCHEKGSEPGHSSRMGDRHVDRSRADRSGGLGPVVVPPVDSPAACG